MPDAVKVLLVEDDPAALLGMQQALELAGFTVETFTDAESTVERSGRDVPAIIVCDVKLPGLDGLALLEKAKSIDGDFAVILITGHGIIAIGRRPGVNETNGRFPIALDGRCRPQHTMPHLPNCAGLQC
jgi:two-component system C4-dicarboxylate transport response regulator DctD